MLEERASLQEEQGHDSRLRRLRKTEPIRHMFRENWVHTSNLMAPVFVRDGEKIVEPISAMPGINRYSVDMLADYVGRLLEEGVKSVLLFGIPSSKDEIGSGAYSNDGVVPRAVRELKSHFSNSLVVATDVCLCEYTSHGHCGVVQNGTVDNELTLPLLQKAANQYALAGSDLLCPSAMMDGQVLAIRKALDASGFADRLVMGYSAKYASSFYGPFREAAASKPAFGDRKAYQMDPGNSREAMREIEADVVEGADIIMVKPALAYLDVISKARAKYDLPIAAYSVSGEYSMVKAASVKGWLDEKSAALEIALSIKRAGADIIITYFAEQLAIWLGELT